MVGEEFSAWLYKNEPGLEDPMILDLRKLLET